MNLIEDELRYNANTQKCYVGLTLAAMLGGITGFLLGGHLAEIAYGHAYILSTALLLLSGFIGLMLPRSTEKVRNTPPLSVLTRLETAFSQKHKHITWIVLATNSYWALRDITVPLLLFEQGYGPQVIGILFAVGAFLGVIASLITRELLHKNHPERIMVASLAIATIASLILPFGGLIVLGVFYALYVSSEVALTPAIGDRIEETAAHKTAEPYITSLSTASALAWAITPWAVGMLLEAGIGLRLMLFIGGVLIAAAYIAAKTRFTPNEYFPKLSWKRKKKGLTW